MAGFSTLAGIGAMTAADPAEEIIDIHQHINFNGRRNPEFLAHQKAMGVSKTVLLPAGTEMVRASTHAGKSNGLAARVFGTEAAARFARMSISIPG